MALSIFKIFTVVSYLGLSDILFYLEKWPDVRLDLQSIVFSVVDQSGSREMITICYVYTAVPQ